MSDSLSSLNDPDLLRRFCKTRCEAAFGELVERYGKLVMSVCLRVLKNRHDAEDAFQATFLVLAEKAGKIKTRDRRSLPSWLCGVAYRLSMNLARKHHRKDLALTAEPVAARDQFSDLEQRFDEQAMDEELHALPVKYRDVLVRFYFLGQTSRQIAEALGITQGAADGRIKRGRQELRVRLAKRGVALGAFTVMALSAQTASASVGSTLVQSTVAAAVAKGSVGACSPSVIKLAGTEMMKSSLLTPGLAMCATCALLGTTVFGLNAAFAHATTFVGGELNTVVTAAEVEQPEAELFQEPSQETEKDEVYELIVKGVVPADLQKALKQYKDDLDVRLSGRNRVRILHGTDADHKKAVELLGALAKQKPVVPEPVVIGRPIEAKTIPIYVDRTPGPLAELKFFKPKLSQDKKSFFIETSSIPTAEMLVDRRATLEAVLANADQGQEPEPIEVLDSATLPKQREVYKLSDVEVNSVGGKSIGQKQFVEEVTKGRRVLVLYKGQKLSSLQREVLKDSLVVVTVPAPPRQQARTRPEQVGIDPAGRPIFRDVPVSEPVKEQSDPGKKK